MSNAFYIGLAYVLTWLVVVAYTTYVERRARRAQERLVAAPAAGSAEGGPDGVAPEWTP